MPRSPSPDYRSERSSSRRHHDRDDRDRSRDRDRDRDSTRRRSRSPPTRTDSQRRSGKERERSRSRSRSRDRSHRSSRRERSASRSRDERHDDGGSSSRRRRDSRRESSRSRDRGRDSSSGSDSEDSRDSRDRSSRRSSRREGKSSSHRSGKRSSRDSGETDRERRKRREEKKERKANREAKRLAKKGVIKEFGKYGVLSEADIYTKADEFNAWLIQERMLNPETLSKQKEKEIFKTFMEDFNTCTLPHEKYYDMKKYETKMAAVRMGETVESTDGGYDFEKDLANAKQSYRKAAAASSADMDALLMDREKLEELRKLQTERIEMEKLKRLGMDIKPSMGIRTEKR
ncbi:uncharacterized protein JCM6883_004114 [Sporobolomyces salmoneus]|uniref:uncharacterized protein n=1 Tax=Sporobolomyces salmoneus TaxID=183962 RepID=UPI00317C0EF2